ncbi:MAG: alpha/beta hydrolase [Solirubrobacteraceae bacterium]
MDRADVEFPSQDGHCAAWLYRPAGDGPAPLVVMAHGFSATREQRLDAYAERFQGAGLGVLLFDYRHFGASPGEPRQLLDIKRQQADFHSAIAYARELECADADRIALLGSSFSGGHVIVVGAQDRRIAAIVAQCPFTDGLAAGPKMGARNLARATWAGLRDQLGALAGRPPRYVPAVGPPGSFAVMSTPDAEPGFAALTPPETLWENRVAARISLALAFYRPGRSAAALACPILFCVCDDDRLTPAAQTLKYAAATPHAEVRRYPVGHFEIYVGDTWEQAVADQTAFFTRSLGVIPEVSPATVTAD